MNILRYYSIGEFAKAIGKTTKILRNWDKSRKLKQARVEDTSYWYYSQEQLYHLLCLKNRESKNKKYLYKAKNMIKVL